MAAQHDSMTSVLADQVERLLARHVTKETLAAAEAGFWPGYLWDACERAGLTLARVPELNGGIGLDPGAAADLVRRLGYHAVPAPVAETMLALSIWTRAGGDPVEGALSFAPTNPKERVRIERWGDEWWLSGVATGVPWGADVGFILVTPIDDSDARFLALVPCEQITTEPRRNIAYESRAIVRLDRAKIPQSMVRPLPAEADVLLQGAAMRAQQMIGAMQRCVDLAITYANERVQFGRAIAKFQSVQHMIVAAAGHCAAAAAAGDLAARQCSEFTIAVAKARAGEAAGIVAASCHQVHGAMGFTQEHSLHFYTRRLWSWRDEFGSDAYWQRRLGILVSRLGGEAAWPLVTN